MQKPITDSIAKQRYDYNITGASGEFFVAAELSRRGVIATLTIKNTPLIDVIATNLEKGVTANIQVKTRSERNTQGWLLNKKSEEETKVQNHFYVFVNLHDINGLPEYYIIPNNILANYIREKHKAWLGKTTKKGKAHVDSNVRGFKPGADDKAFAEEYRNNWQALGIF